MAYLSSFTGQQVDDAVERVNDNRFSESILSATTVAAELETGQRVQLSPALGLSPNTDYQFELAFTISGFIPSTLLMELVGQDIGSFGDEQSQNFVEIYCGGFDSNEAFAYKRTSIIAGPAQSSGFNIRDVIDIAGSSDEYNFRVFGQVRTGANPQGRFEIQRGTEAGASMFVQRFTSSFSRVYPENSFVPAYI